MFNNRESVSHNKGDNFNTRITFQEEKNGIKLHNLDNHEDEPNAKDPTNEPSPSDTEETDDDDFVNVDDPANSKLNTVDKWSRLCFPMAYLMFNLCYWVLFLFPTS